MASLKSLSFQPPCPTTFMDKSQLPLTEEMHQQKLLQKK